MPTTCAITYCEGLPGLGKTTAVLGLAAGVERVVLVAENNPLPADHEQVAGLDPAGAARWYLHAERRRSAYAARLAHRGAGHVVCDKGALATLAYIYASSQLGLHPPTLYGQIRDLYLRDIRPHLTADATTILFTGTVGLGLTRRAAKPDRALRPVWFDPAFLHAQARFYTDEAPDLAPGRLLPLDASTDRPGLLARLATGLDLTHPVLPDHGLDPVDHQDLPRLFRETAEQIGHPVLGQALGRPFRHLTDHAQVFERHLLIARSLRHRLLGGDDTTVTVQLQAQQWTAPADQTPPPATDHRGCPRPIDPPEKGSPSHEQALCCCHRLRDRRSVPVLPRTTRP